MDVQTVYSEIVANDPEYAVKLGQALTTVGDSGILDILLTRAHAAILTGGLGDSDEQLLQQIREVRWQTAVLQQLQSSLQQLTIKELSDES